MTAALATVLIGGTAAGCGGSSHKGNSSVSGASPAASTPAGAPTPTSAPPVSEAALESGPPIHQVQQTIVAFYRATWENQPTTACSLFSQNGRQGFMKAAKTSFPQSINSLSTCEHAMQIYNATLASSAQNTQENDPAFSPAALDNVGVLGIKINGDRAQAIAPTNVTDLINPKQIDLVHVGRRWLIEDSKSINKSNLAQILARAKADGQLAPKK